jgi:L-seryl-tRNA(Ser) seleniumtransferase
MGFYDSLGVRRVVNASTTFTALGGSLMPPEVLDAMREAAGSFVDMEELHLAAGRGIAELTRNEAAYVTSGCAAALVLAVMGCRAGGDPRLIARLPEGAGLPAEVVVHAAHRIPYDPVLGLAGARVRQIGNALQTFEWELEAALTADTAAVLYVAGRHLARGALPLPTVVRIARERGVPVLVDAAAQLPPVENLWHFTTGLGADLVAFSGGKALHGPQASGLLLGRADLVEAARRNGAPFQRPARPMKAGKEEIAGLYAAVRRYVGLDHDAVARGWEATLAYWAGELAGLPGVAVERDPFNEAGQPVPRLRVDVDPRAAAADAAAVLDRLRGGDPAIAVLPAEDPVTGTVSGFWLGPDLLAGGEAEIVAAALRRLLG